MSTDYGCNEPVGLAPEVFYAHTFIAGTPVGLAAEVFFRGTSSVTSGAFRFQQWGYPIVYARALAEGQDIGAAEVPSAITPGETVAAKMTIYFRVYASDGRPASGNSGDASVFSPGASDIQTNRDLAGFVNYAGTFTHVGDGLYRYTFNASEVSGSVEGNIDLRLKATGMRTAQITVPIRHTANNGQIKPNSLVDNYTYDTGKHPLTWRVRIFASETATDAATPGHPDNTDGEIERYIVTATYNGDGTLATYKMDRAL